MTNSVKTNAQVKIKINGGAATPAFMRSLHEVVVDTNLHLPTMFTIRLWDNDAKWADNASLIKIGNAVDISMIAATQGNRSGAESVLVKGEITSIEPNFMTYGAILTIVGYCKSHRLHRGKKTRTFVQQKDSEIVSKIARESGVSTTAEDSSVKHEYVIQYNQSNYEFISERAARIGYRFWVEGTTLFFKKAANATGTPIDLLWGDTLRRFQPRLTSAQQALNFKTHGWDPKTKKEVVATSTLKALIPSTSIGTAAVTGAAVFGEGDSPTITVPTGVQAYATQMANANADLASGRSIQAEGEAIGDPRLIAGNAVKIEGVGSRFGGIYTITAASHHYDSEDTYLTKFTISGRDPATLYAIVAAENGNASGREFGVVIGLVTNTKDPDDMGRIKVKFPWLGTDHESNWARIASPMAGKERGFYFLPEVNDEVLVAFDHGDPHHPFIVGYLWSGKDKPPLAIGTALNRAEVAQRIIKTTSGHQIIFSDKTGEQFIKIIDKTTKNSIHIDSVKNDITILCEGNFTVTAKGKVEISSQMDASLISKTGKMTIDGKTGATVNTAAQLKLSGTGGAELSSTASTAVKGSVVQVQGSGPVTVAGNPIKLN